MAAEIQTPAVEQNLAELYIQAELLAPVPATTDMALIPESPTPAAALVDIPGPSAPSEIDSSVPELNDEVNIDELQKELAEPAEKRQKRSRSGSRQCKQYVVKFKGNNCRQWDGKPIVVDADWIEELYNKSELFPGRVIELDWPDPKDGKNVSWSCVIVNVPVQEQADVPVQKQAGELSGEHASCSCSYS